jgi:hypothetical protein
MIPVGSHVVSAILDISATAYPYCAQCRVEFRSFVGDGQATVDDLSKGTKFATVDAGAEAYVLLDVTDFVASMIEKGKLDAGVRLDSIETGTDDYLTWSASSSAITITYNRTAFVRAFPDGAGAGTFTSKPTGIHCNEIGCEGYFEVGKTLVITAKPATGSTFGAWNGSYCKGQDATCSFVVPDAEVGVVARFDKAAAATPKPSVATAPTTSAESSPAGPSPTPEPSATASPIAPTASPLPATAIPTSGAGQPTSEPIATSPTGSAGTASFFAGAITLMIVAIGATIALRRRSRA